MLISCGERRLSSLSLVNLLVRVDIMRAVHLFLLLAAVAAHADPPLLFYDRALIADFDPRLEQRVNQPVKVSELCTHRHWTYSEATC